MPNPKCKVIVKNKFAKIYPSNLSYLQVYIFLQCILTIYVCIYKLFRNAQHYMLIVHSYSTVNKKAGTYLEGGENITY